MKRISLFLIGCLTLWAASAQEATQPTLEQLGSIYYAYPTPSGHLTSAPAGYTPCYISHYGRHGSRWLTADSRYSVLIQLFDSLSTLGQLTPLGEDVRQRLYRVWEDAQGCSGNITPLGEQQHRQIADRMYRRFPQVFSGRAVVDARSSTSVRCALSMSYFTERLKEYNPSLQVSRRPYARYMSYIAYTSPEGEAFSSEQAEWRKGAFHDFEMRQVRPARLLASLFTRPEGFNERQADDLARNFYWLAADMQNVSLPGMSFYDLFTYEELRGIWLTVNARMYVCNANAPQAGGVMTRCAVPLLRNIIESAEASLAQPDQPAAHLRFGHDTHLIRLLALTEVEGCAVPETDMDRFHLAWQDYRVSPMAANLQLIFFRHAERPDDLLVLLLHNEEEARLPIPSYQGPYYRWKDVKQFWEAKCK